MAKPANEPAEGDSSPAEEAAEAKKCGKVNRYAQEISGRRQRLEPTCGEPCQTTRISMIFGLACQDIPSGKTGLTRYRDGLTTSAPHPFFQRFEGAVSTVFDETPKT